MRRFDEDFDNFVLKERNNPVLIGSWTDINGKTVVAYAESGQQIKDTNEENKYRMVVLDSNLPVFDEKEGSGPMGWATILSRAPLYVLLCNHHFIQCFVHPIYTHSVLKCLKKCCQLFITIYKHILNVTV